MSAMVRLSEAADGLTEVRALVLRLRGILNAVGLEVDALEAENAKLRAALAWALGESDDFRPREDGDGPYWWRKELRERAGLTAALTPEPR